MTRRTWKFIREWFGRWVIRTRARNVHAALMTLFESALRKFDSEAPKWIAAAGPQESINWDGTQLRDHLTPADWKVMNDALIAETDNDNRVGIAIRYARWWRIDFNG